MDQGAEIHLRQLYKVTAAVLTFDSVWCLPAGWQSGGALRGAEIQEKLRRKKTQPTWTDAVTSHWLPAAGTIMFVLTPASRAHKDCAEKEQHPQPSSDTHTHFCFMKSILKTLWEPQQEHYVRKTIPWHFSPPDSMQISAKLRGSDNFGIMCLAQIVELCLKFKGKRKFKP